MTEQQQVDALWACQQDRADDQDRDLIDALIDRVSPLRGVGDHVSQVYEVILETGLVAYFKPVNAFREANSALKRALHNYNQTPLSTVVNECAAWQLARELGGVWEEFAMPAVLRAVAVPSGATEVGSLARFRPGTPNAIRRCVQAVPAKVSAGAFFDCLIGQQDRNPGNVLWQEDRQRMSLIDNAFSFARWGDNRGVQSLQEWRWGHGDRALNGDETQALDQLIQNDLFGLADFLESDRATAVAERAALMRETGLLLAHAGRMRKP